MWGSQWLVFVASRCLLIYMFVCGASLIQATCLNSPSNKIEQMKMPSGKRLEVANYATYYTILYYTILYYTILYYTILSYPILSYPILYYTLYYTILFYIILYSILFYTKEALKSPLASDSPESMKHIKPIKSNGKPSKLEGRLSKAPIYYAVLYYIRIFHNIQYTV